MRNQTHFEANEDPVLPTRREQVAAHDVPMMDDGNVMRRDPCLRRRWSMLR